MSEPISFLAGREAKGRVTVRDAGLQGMITLRADLSAAKVKTVVRKVTGQPVPEVRKAEVEGGRGAVWMSPDELLLLVAYADAEASVAEITKALAGTHVLAVNVSDARAYLTLSGPDAREVLAKVAPVDLHPDQFVPGDFRRTRLGQVAGAFWLDTAQTFHLVCFRSVGDYLFDLLVASGEAGPVGVF